MTIRDISYVGEELILAPLHGPALRYEPLPLDAIQMAVQVVFFGSSHEWEPEVAAAARRIFITGY